MNANVIMPHGALGKSDNDNSLETFLRDLAVEASTDPGEWAEKYGTNFENDVFMMHQFCWCEQPDCPWCNECVCETVEECNEKCTNKEYAPHFHYKPSDLKIRWYKYIGRSMEFNRELTEHEFEEMTRRCLESLFFGASESTKRLMLREEKK